MKYELYIEFVGDDYLYFDTDKEWCDTAYEEFEDLMCRLRVNMDNMRVQNLEIRRKSDGKVLDECWF